MYIFRENNLKSMILEILAKGPKDGVDLIEKIKTIRKDTTKQGIYKALRVLIKEKVIIKHRKSIMLNQIWINKLNNLVQQTDENYLISKKPAKTDTLDWMKEGSRIHYVFDSYDSLDRFHSHIFSLIIKKTDTHSPLFAYSPHEWFILKTNLKENEDYLFDWLRDRNRQTYFTIGHKTSLDKKFRDAYSSEGFEIAIDENTSYPENYYLNIIGNFVIEMKNEISFANKLHEIYLSTKSENEASEEIKELLKAKHKIRMTLSCDEQKAKRLKTKLGKNFLIPKELRDK